MLCRTQMKYSSPTDYVLCYDCNDTVDKSSNNNTAILSNVTYTTDMNNIANNAWAFNGTSSIVATTNIVDLSKSDKITLSCWARFSNSAVGSFMELSSNPGTNLNVFSFRGSNSNSPPSKISYVEQVSSGGVYSGNRSNTDYGDNAWRHYLITSDRSNNAATQINIYVNGVITTSTNDFSFNSSGVYSNLFKMYFGGRGTLASNWLKGAMSKIKVYSRILTDIEILSLYSECSTIPRTSLVGEWLFNGNAFDTSGNVKNGTVNGATLATGRTGITNSAYSFNGSLSNNITISSIVLGNNFTVSAWINFYSTVATSYFIGGSAYGIRYNGTTFLIATSGNSTTLAWTKVNRVVHFCCVRTSASNFNIYIDNVLIGSVTEAVNNSLTVVSLGKRVDGYPFTGTMEDIRFYDRSLNIAEISVLFNELNL